MLAQQNLGTNYRQSETQNGVAFASSNGWGYTPGPKEIDIKQYIGKASTYVSEYVTYLQSEMKGDFFVSGNLITLAELKSLGCTIQDDYSYTGNETCANSKYSSWLVNDQNWWTRSTPSSYGGTGGVWGVSSSGILDDTYYVDLYGIRPVITMISNSDLGTKITIASEDFYVVENDGENVKLLAKHNLNVGYVYTDETTYTELTPTEIKQDATMIGIPEDQSYPRYGTIKRANAEDYLNQYVENLKNKSNLNITGSLLDVGLANKINKYFDYEWFYNSSYWLYDTFAGGGVGYYVNTSKSIITTSDYQNLAGIRPVITMSIEDYNSIKN